ncbi:hypothetical protein ACTHGU_19495 [Chitinophagaceae bacterium MMS25-I14]
MKYTKAISVILTTLYSLIIILFLLDELSGFDIKNQLLKSAVYIGLPFYSAGMFIYSLVSYRAAKRKIAGILIPVIIIALVIVAGPFRVLQAAAAWHTQEILYEHGHFSFMRIETQMRDMGAHGYKTRTVKVCYLTPLFMITSDVPENIDPHLEWIKVDKEVNEMELK